MTIEEKRLTVEDGVVTFLDTTQPFEIRLLNDEVKSPWGFDFLPDGRLLVTEKEGKLRIFDIDTRTSAMIEGLPAVHSKGQGGLLDVVVHNDFETNGWIYLSAAVEVSEKKRTTRIMRYRLENSQLKDATEIYEAQPAVDANIHFGSAMVFDTEGHLYITVGDRRQRYLSQDLGTSLGKVIRLRDDGSVPVDNPFLNRPDALPEIFSYGHRNPQGITIDRASGRIWVAEHGPRGGDEINLLQAGTNYGWPVITYGEEYAGGKIGEGTEKVGMAQPEYHYVPSIGTAGIAWYDGDALPGWQGNLFVAGLRSTSVSRVNLRSAQETEEQRLLEQFAFRFRNIKQGPDGFLYLLGENGGILQITPLSQ
ncbi:MAG: PQQ-dependent sugar dehydrogenase [Halioglobus sp.]